MISYAQNFEDVMLARVFAGRDTGFYVDVGAADPVNLSVTKWFYDLGWSGINIEPNRHLFERLTADRPRDINLDCGVGATTSEAQFLELDVGELSSFNDRVRRDAEADGGTTRLVRVMPLTDLLEQHCAGQAIDFLKIDVEGWELEVLKGLDLGRFRPTVILAEATVPQTRIASHGEWEPLLLGGNYSFVYFDGVNRFYLANEHVELAEHFTCPPNAFDEFETFSLVRAQRDAEQRLEAMKALEKRMIQIEHDATARLVMNTELERRLAESELDRAARLDATQKLERRLAKSESDRAARLDAIHELERRLAESESDRAARLDAIHELERRLAESESDRAARLAAIHELERRLAESELDRAARLDAIHELERLLLDAERTAVRHASRKDDAASIIERAKKLLIGRK